MEFNLKTATRKWTQLELSTVAHMRVTLGLSWETISAEFAGSTRNSVRKAMKRYSNPKETENPKILLVDIETSPMLGFIWGLFDQNVGLSQIKTDWHILSWSAKWLGDSEDSVMYMDQRNAKNIEDDTKLLSGIWKLLNEATAIITQNGKRFDQKKLNARFIQKGFAPPSSYRHIDTLQIAKRHFGFSSNKLAYLTDKLCTKYKKSEHAKFAGFNLWKECLNGNIEAYKEMEAYNKLDVLSLEELYLKLRPWDKTINFNIYTDSFETVCSCGSIDIVKNGFTYTNLAQYQRYTCKKCGAEFRDRTNLLSKEKRKSLKS